MPKAKPTQVILHRVELQEKERDMLEGLATAKTAETVVKGVVLPVAVGGTLYLGYKALKSSLNWGSDAIDEVKNSYGAIALKTMNASPSGLPVVGPFVKAGELIYKLFTTKP